MTSKTLISIVGPTAIGKTKLAIAIAAHFETEIISADSRQFFKEMAIGTAVPTIKELQTVPHHFVHHKSIFDSYSVGDFERDALKQLDELFTEKKIVVMAGGSGLYVDAVNQGLNFFPEVDRRIRENLNLELQDKGISVLQQQLQLLDPQYYHKVDKANPHRLIRALEICLGTGKPYSSFLKKTKQERPFHTIVVGLAADRPVIYERINTRVDHMMEKGLLNEAELLNKFRDLNALRTVGYQELFRHFDGEWSLEFAISEIKKNTRRYAKRQMTWFNKNENIIWVDHQSDKSILVDLLSNKIKVDGNH